MACADSGGVHLNVEVVREIGCAAPWRRAPARAGRYAATDASVVAALDESDAFGQLLGAAGRVAAQHAEMAGGDVAAMFISLAQFASGVYPGQLGLVDRVLAGCHEARAHFLET